MKARRIIAIVLVVCIAGIGVSNSENSVSQFASSEIQRLKDKGLSDKHPIILSLQGIIDEDNESIARSKIVKYLESTIERKDGVGKVDFLWIEMRCPQASDQNQLVEAKRRLLDALAPLIVSGKIMSLKTLQDGFLFCIQSVEVKKLGGLEYKLGYNYSLVVKEHDEVDRHEETPSHRK